MQRTQVHYTILLFNIHVCLCVRFTTHLRMHLQCNAIMCRNVLIATRATRLILILTLSIVQLFICVYIVFSVAHLNERLVVYAPASLCGMKLKNCYLYFKCECTSGMRDTMTMLRIVSKTQK